MRYNIIRSMDISNGEGVGVSLFTQGCPYRCEGCFNEETWDYSGGEEWTKEIEEKFLNLLNKKHITRVSILGGEPMEYPIEISYLIYRIKQIRPDIKIWIYSGDVYENLIKNPNKKEIISKCDVLVDGPFVISEKDITLKWRGSKNQRVIDVKKTIESNSIKLYCN